MTKKEVIRKKELARMYYMQGEPQKFIAEKIGVSAQTLSRWAEKDACAVKRAGLNITRPELVNKSLAALNRILDQVYESEDVQLIAALPDKLVKFAAAIEKLDKKSNIVSYMDAFISLNKFLQKLSAPDGDKESPFRDLTPDFIRTLNKYQDLYINEHINL